MNQKKAWNKIASEWAEFRKTPDEKTIDFLKKQKGNILDLGCGSGRNFTKVNGKLYGVDFSRKMLKFAKPNAKKFNVKLVKAKAEKLPFKDNFFDAAIFMATLHCIETKDKKQKAISELYRVLKKGTKAKIAVWNKNSKWFKNRSKDTEIKWRNKTTRYLYLYDDKEVYKEFENAGFKILKKCKPEKNIVFIVGKM
ncbi:MAG: class I SAM-dependent methyltransferase [Nanoarchaeota archaeon]|nr:class I SAM-dependent methyltransferase [Nanoarchaeota archaeon]